MDLSIIIVSWKIREKLKENLKSIYEREILSDGELRFEVFVVDNNSNDGTVIMVKKEFPKVILIENNYNAGFAKASNQAIKNAAGDYILLLNPDMRVFPDTLKNMTGWMKENKGAGVASCQLINKDGNNITNARRFPKIFDQLVIVLKLPHIFPGVVNKYLMKDFNYNKEQAADSVRGSFFMIRKEVLDKVGLLDERYFLWFEEVDYCQKIKKAGYKIMYTPVAKCLDYVGQSFSKLPRSQAQRYFRDSQLKYFKKWQPAWQYYLLKLVWPIGLGLTWLGEKMKYKVKS
ncbi:MAG: glycosyltransferase family 2 protein [Patescibacteria group bacterium]